MITTPATSPNIGEILSSQHAISKGKNIEALHQIFSSIKFLCRQGLALRGGVMVLKRMVTLSNCYL